MSEFRACYPNYQKEALAVVFYLLTQGIISELKGEIGRLKEKINNETVSTNTRVYSRKKSITEF